jgi:hypothetical protein
MLKIVSIPSLARFMATTSDLELFVTLVAYCKTLTIDVNQIPINNVHTANSINVNPFFDIRV